MTSPEVRLHGRRAGAGPGQPAGAGEAGQVAADRRPVLLVSACLLGVGCNHRGAASRRETVERLGGRFRLVPVCPEVLGGLTTPRPAAELTGGDGADALAGRAEVRTATGRDVTAAYLRGAAAAVALARATGASGAVLKARSPSCGTAGVYDGTFTRTLTSGRGVTAAALAAAGVPIRSDEDLERDGGAPPGGSRSAGVAG